MTVNQFIRLAAELADKTADVRRTIEHMGAGNLAAAADTAGGRGSETWWAAEFFILRLSHCERDWHVMGWINYVGMNQ
ncbi:hypothetical protein EB077_13470 [bacterium]|nr:hypothetical protein [bacterium]